MNTETNESKLPAQRKRANTITFRVNDKELELFNQKVEKYQLSKQSYFLFTALEKPILKAEDLKNLIEISKQLGELVKQTRGIANNINQMTIFCHLNYAIPEYEEMVEIQNELKSIKKEEDTVWQLLRQLISQLKAMGL